jgi:hypothetical protein
LHGITSGPGFMAAYARRWPQELIVQQPCSLYVHRPSSEHRLLLLTNDDEGYGWDKWASHYVRSPEAAETRPLQGPAVTGIYIVRLNGNPHSTALSIAAGFTG